ncbi:hypothetical protein [uncultured Mucilaginibacter sp.]|uniref:hypothetical protein n=1 Tax=uncultured Mucilaginibacter sp. TaxID=797541 RepID=UPI0025E5EE48|nr:hypothetical protein [uncultured Mucilaginibacter sp.]
MHGGGFFTIFLIIAAISLLFDWYVFAGLKTLTKEWNFIKLRYLVTFGYLFVTVGVTLILLLDFKTFQTAKGMTPLHEWILSIFLTLLFTKLFFVIILFLGDIGRFFLWRR